MTTQKELILMEILNCGSCDLSLLERINYDLYEIIRELTESNNLNLHSILAEVFVKGAYELYEKFEEQKKGIEKQIKEEIELYKNEVQRKVFLEDLELLYNGKLDPLEGLEYSLNYLATYVYMKNIDFYRRWLKKEVDNIEYKMGWSFLGLY